MKKRSKPGWLQVFCIFGLENDTSCAAKKVMTFFFFFSFFFFGDHPYFSLSFCICHFALAIKSRAASQRPAFDEEKIEKAINLVS